MDEIGFSFAVQILCLFSGLAGGLLRVNGVWPWPPIVILNLRPPKPPASEFRKAA